MTYFDDCTTQEQVKTKYRKLAKEYHPDHGGNTDTFKAMQKEYENWKPKSNHSSEEQKYYQGFDWRDTQNDPYDEFGFGQQKQYGGTNQYSDIRFNHPIFQELAKARQTINFYKNAFEKLRLSKNHIESKLYNMSFDNAKFIKEISSLREELIKKKATATRLKNKIKKMQEHSVKKKNTN
jgi:curved DNA-binding protein CbpA